MTPATDLSIWTRTVADAYACMIRCEHISIVLDFVFARLYDIGYSVWRMRSQELCVPTLVRRRVHPLGELIPSSASPGSRRSLEENPCPGAMAKWCL